MVQAVADRYFEALELVPKYDPDTDELVSKYIQGAECVCTGLVNGHFEVDRYFGKNHAEVKNKSVVQIIPREKDALEPAHQLRYDTSLISSPHVDCRNDQMTCYMLGIDSEWETPGKLHSRGHFAILCLTTLNFEVVSDNRLEVRGHLNKMVVFTQSLFEARIFTYVLDERYL